MPDDRSLRVTPWPAFNFRVEIVRDDGSSPLARAAFSECDGLEMTQEVKTLREGGNPLRVHRLAGAPGCGQLTLKRGVTEGADLWRWFSDSLRQPALRAGVTVIALQADGRTPWARFVLDRCLPVKLKAPALNARDGAIAVEELQLAYETLDWQEAGNG